MPTRIRDTCRKYPPFSRSNGSANKNLQRKSESGIHDAWRILRKPSKGVVVYAWSEGRPPTLREFQSGFSWPFILISEILSVVDVTGAGSTTRSRVQLYRRVLGVWVGVDAGYVVVPVQAIVFSLKRATFRTPSNSTSTFKPARRRPWSIYVTTSLERSCAFARD